MATDPMKQFLQQSMPKPSSMVSFTEHEIAATGRKIGNEREHTSGLLHRTSGTQLGYCGATGHGIESSHSMMRDQCVDTYHVADQVLKSWLDAFQVADARYVEAEDQSKPPPFDGPGGPGKLHAGGPGLGGLGGGVPDLGQAGLKPQGPDMPDLKDPRLKDPGVSMPDTNQPDVPQPDLQQPDLNQPDFQQPNLQQPDLKTPDLTTPDLDRNGIDPSKTQLSDYHPPTPTTPSAQLPGGVADPGRTTVGYGGSGSGYTGSGTGVGGAARPLAAGTPAGGMPMMPMMPMGGQGPAAGEGKEKAGTTAAREDETVWEGDEDIAPAVLSHEDV